MISCGAFSIFKRFSAGEKPFHEMPHDENDYLLGGTQEKLENSNLLSFI
jgi:hypothetical protein